MTGAGISIARLGAEDLDAVEAIEKASYARPWSREGLLRELAFIGYSRVWGAKDASGALLGFAVVWVIADEGHLANLAVAPAARRRGVGGLLMGEALADAARRGAKCLLLEVRVGNAPAIALYREFGLRDDGLRKKYYEDNGEDALLMRIDL